MDYAMEEILYPSKKKKKLLVQLLQMPERVKRIQLRQLVFLETDILKWKSAWLCDPGPWGHLGCKHHVNGLN